MALEDLVGSDKYLSALNPAWPTDDDWLDEGDNHVRGIKNVLRNTFPNLDGAIVATDEELNAAIASSALDSNVIINGDFQIWQRGTTFAPAAGVSYTADRWCRTMTGVTATFEVAQSGAQPSVAEAGRLFLGSMTANCLVAEAALSAGTQLSMFQPIEGYHWQALAQRPCVLSFWVLSNQTGIHCVAVKNAGDRSFVAEYTIDAANVWQFVTVQVPASPAAGTWNYLSGLGAVVVFALAAGSNLWSGAAGSWAAVNAISTANAVNFASVAGNQFLVTGIDIRPGTVTPAPYESRSYVHEYALCRRYFQKIGFATGLRIHGARSDSTSVTTWSHPLVPPMRITPAVTQKGTVLVNDGSVQPAVSSIANASSPEELALALTTPATLTAVRACFISFDATSGYWCDAEI